MFLLAAPSIGSSDIKSFLIEVRFLFPDRLIFNFIFMVLILEDLQGNYFLMLMLITLYVFKAELIRTRVCNFCSMNSCRRHFWMLF